MLTAVELETTTPAPGFNTANVLELVNEADSIGIS